VVALAHVGTDGGGKDERGASGGGAAMASAHVDTDGGGKDERGGDTTGWREIDRQLRRVAKARGRLDGEELLWLARAERAEIHRQLGHATILEYVERVLGHGPRVARERLRVARALETLPRLRAELESARLSYSAVREVSRVAKPSTEERWIERVSGLSLREVEEAMAAHKPGDDPDDAPDPDLAMRPITFELTPRTLALLRDATRMLEDEVGHPMTDDQLIATSCASALRDGGLAAAASVFEPELANDDAVGGGGDDGDRVGEADGRDPHDHDRQPTTGDLRIEPHRGHVGTVDRPGAPPAPYQIALTVCVSCKRATHDAAGRSFDVSTATLEQALCNAQHLGRVDVAIPARATRDVPPATVRLVWRRDGGRCVVPGCRSTRHIEVHHIVFRSDGGDHSPGNLACLCFAHHAALHEGKLVITGTAPDQLVFERIDPLHAPAQTGPRGPACP
jgi:hypothetical protein